MSINHYICIAISPVIHRYWKFVSLGNIPHLTGEMELKFKKRRTFFIDSYITCQAQAYVADTLTSLRGKRLGMVADQGSNNLQVARHSIFKVHSRN